MEVHQSDRCAFIALQETVFIVSALQVGEEREKAWHTTSGNKQFPGSNPPVGFSNPEPIFSGVWRCKLKILNLKCMQNLLASLLVICYLHHFTYVSCGGVDLELVLIWQICRYQVHNLTITVLHCLEHRTFCYTMEKGSNSHVG